MSDPIPPPIQPPGDYSKPPVTPAPGASSSGLHYVVPVDTSGLAIIAGYLGLFSVLGVFGPFAILFGVLALADINKHPAKHGKGRAWFAIVMGVIGSLGLLYLAIAAYD